MALTMRLPSELDESLNLISVVEGLSKHSLVKEAVESLVKQRLEDPDFQQKLKDFIKPLQDIINILEL